MRIALVQQRATEDLEANLLRGLEAAERAAGESFVCGPDGRVLARAGRGTEETLLCDIDLAEVERSHARRLFLRDRRPEVYGGWGICG